MSTFPPWFQEICQRLQAADVSLENLNLNIRRMDEEMMQALANSLVHSRSLRVLNLTSSVMNDPSALKPLFSQSMAPSLQILHLNYNQINDDAILPLGHALATNQYLQEIHLDYNEISVIGARSIAKGLECNTSLRVLQMNYNHIQTKGLVALAQAMKRNTTLHQLGLRCNGIRSIEHFVDLLLHHNETLSILSLEDNTPVAEYEDDERTTIRIMRKDQQALLATANVYCRFNQAGRRIAHQAILPQLIAPVVDPSVVYLFLQTHLFRNSFHATSSKSSAASS